MHSTGAKGPVLPAGGASSAAEVIAAAVSAAVAGGGHAPAARAAAAPAASAQQPASTTAPTRIGGGDSRGGGHSGGGDAGGAHRLRLSVEPRTVCGLSRTARVYARFSLQFAGSHEPVASHPPVLAAPSAEAPLANAICCAEVVAAVAGLRAAAKACPLKVAVVEARG